ncbi:structural maintenance of chromosomes protein 4 [Physcia stellaris]|nr:structural maintenance of chromosomes protein 4 [Physcia stellaris]
MTTKPLSIDEFFTKLSTLFDARRNSTHGSIYLTQKRLTSPSSSQPASNPTPPATSPPVDAPFPDLNPSQPLPLIIRASNGKSKSHREQGEKIKISTIVQPDEVEKFFVRYAEVMKSGTSGLKKRDRSGRKKKEREKERKKEAKDGKGGKGEGT